MPVLLHGAHHLEILFLCAMPMNFHFIHIRLHGLIGTMGYRKFRLSVHRKNEERRKKRKLSLIVSLQLDQISCGSCRKKCQPICQPCSVSSEIETSELDSFIVSLPLPPEKQPFPSSLCLSPHAGSTTPSEQSLQPQQQPFTSVSHFRSTVIASMSLPDGWVDLTSGGEQLVTLSKLQHYPGKPVQSSHTLQINSDFTWNVYVHGHLAQRSQCSLLSDVPERLQCKEDFNSLFAAVCDSNVCIGNPDERFEPLKVERKGVFKNANGDRVVAYVDTKASVLDGSQSYSETIRHNCCELLAAKSRCIKCASYRDSLRSMASRHISLKSTNRSARVSTSSRVNFRYLKSPEKSERYNLSRQEAKVANKEVIRLQKLLENTTQRDGVSLSSDVHNTLFGVMKENAPKIEKAFPEGSFRQLFWRQQFEAASKTDARQMRWHPMMIKWCLYLKLRSSSTYHALRSSGCLTLPTERTLRDYTHYFKGSVGFQAKLDEQLLRESDVNNLEDWQKYVVLMFDEMKIREDLVYDKRTGELTGFVNLGDINEHLQHFEQIISNDVSDQPNLASSMLVFMVKGIFTKLEFPYAHFPCASLSAEFLYPIVWDAIQRVEALGLKVLVLTCDGAGPNRKFFRLHKDKDVRHKAQRKGRGKVQQDGCREEKREGEKVQQTPTVNYKTLNPYSEEERWIYFVSDVPHLIKTTRNCWANEKRHLWVSCGFVSVVNTCTYDIHVLHAFI